MFKQYVVPCYVPRLLDYSYVLLCVAGMMLIGQRGVLLTAMDDDPGALPQRILELTAKTIAAVLVATLAVAAADLVWSRLLWRRDNRMSKHEVKEELKQAEGDRMIKARLRSLKLDRSRKTMLSAVPRATMVVVNPTHYAVAMRYLRSEGEAPIVLTKGVDLIALKIRAIAEAHDVPVVEDKPLARSLHAAVDGRAADPGGVLSCGRRDRAPHSAEEIRMGSTKGVAASCPGARGEARPGDGSSPTR